MHIHTHTHIYIYIYHGSESVENPMSDECVSRLLTEGHVCVAARLDLEVPVVRALSELEDSSKESKAMSGPSMDLQYIYMYIYIYM